MKNNFHDNNRVNIVNFNGHRVEMERKIQYSKTK